MKVSDFLVLFGVFILVICKRQVTDSGLKDINQAPMGLTPNSHHISDVSNA